jgi:hypothetical protein
MPKMTTSVVVVSFLVLCSQFLLEVRADGSCPIGMYDNNGNCFPCDNGQYGPSSGLQNCFDCSRGKYTPNNGTGFSACLNCQLGRVANDTGASSCLDCPVGTFQNSVGSSRCLMCSAGSFQNLSGSSTCLDCPASYVSPAGSSGCKYCDYLLAVWKDTSKSVSSCSTCGLGNILNISDPADLSCFACSPGFYSSVQTRTSCDECAAGSYQTNSGYSSCTPCEQGKFSSIQGRSSNCQECEGGTTITIGSLDQSFCVICDEGYFGSPPRNPCTKCPISPGISCPRGTPTPIVAPGYWRINQISVLQCSPPAACESTGANNFTTCAVQYTGNNCGMCNSQYYRLGLDCKKCPAAWVQTLTILAFVVVFVTILARLMLGEGKFSPDVRVAIQAMQIMSLYTTISPNWPPYVKSLINALSFSVRTVFEDCD